MPEAVIAAARRFLKSFIKPGRILVAISGGSDSKGLLSALHEALDTHEFNGFSLAACTVDHALRPESAGEAAAVGAFCAGLGIPHRIGHWQGDKPRSGIQAAARRKRYDLLAEAAAAFAADCIVTGHTRDDQNETIAMRAARDEGRGPGSAGMAAAMLFGRRIWVLRPFIRVRRADIRTFLEARGIGWLDDPSNENPLFERARVRARLAVAEHAPGSQRDGLLRAASSARAAALLLEHLRVHEGLVAEVAAAQAGRMDDADWRRALMTVAAVIGGREHPPGRATVERLSGFLRSGEVGRMTAGRVVFDRRRDGLYLYREERDLPLLRLGAGESGSWDGRFTIASLGPALTISAEGEGGMWRQRLIAAGLPEGIAKRASLVAPRAEPADSAGSGAETAAARLECRIGPYDTFLPGFDRSMADTIALLFGRDRYAPPPVEDVLTEMEG
ncbi:MULTISPECIES: tRNA lysidine(34) synthetase TilS [Sinorhizobium]|uniref:tRNA(Ile)-lysidine synthase n=2 Tax=Sinorhizobium TaxID=28105 RepID=A0A2S3YG29_9HYPH|nr:MULTISPECIES: tRNA lysidine(34) synthetase TilS [Sinorhizobium]AUX77785.1 tRNA(Ile)-lysidine synthase [Sinorhizobium fredii]PDT40100.1 tRNA lysidine(34) synthetase TilS [Sinorhizobium sp. FG01]PDT51587.1 tRNA lysidine(34) synthetase TilS [Sinorhizobium sp. NG07B]POH25189.1 tRNA(Ile)-lysidine synthetase [Sinorhizobium americanum]POH26550.1 tRNA(Ile)-lysidine synthetase [Sinorhizobium americanum]